MKPTTKAGYEIGIQIRRNLPKKFQKIQPISGQFLEISDSDFVRWIEDLRYVMVNFYAEPTGAFTKQIHICALTEPFTRWAVMGKPCNAEAQQYYGYTGYVAESAMEEDEQTPVILARVANNKAIGLPFGTRVWTDLPKASKHSNKLNLNFIKKIIKFEFLYKSL